MKNKIKSKQRDIRIDNFLSMNFNLTRTKSQKIIKANLLKINNVIINKSKTIVNENDLIEFDDFNEEIKLVPIKMNLDIKYEDEYLLIINKPSGLVVHPGAGNKDNTLVHGLLYYLKNNISFKDDEIRPGIVHRLDKDTEGLLLIAKTDDVHTKLQKMIFDKEVKRYYRALVLGKMEHMKGIIDAPIQRDLHKRQQYIVGSTNGKSSKTKFKVVENYTNFSLVEIELLSGRTHQIRVHFKYINHPILNDSIYGNRNLTNDLYDEYHQFLQAYKLIFIHPITKKDIEVEIKIPSEFREVMKNNF